MVSVIHMPQENIIIIGANTIKIIDKIDGTVFTANDICHQCGQCDKNVIQELDKLLEDCQKIEDKDTYISRRNNLYTKIMEKNSGVSDPFVMKCLNNFIKKINDNDKKLDEIEDNKKAVEGKIDYNINKLSRNKDLLEVENMNLIKEHRITDSEKGKIK